MNGHRRGIATHQVFMSRKSDDCTPVRMASLLDCGCGWTQTVHTLCIPRNAEEKKASAEEMLARSYKEHMQRVQVANRGVKV